MSTPPDRQAIRLVLVDDHPVVLAGLAALLDREPDFSVVAQCSHGGAAIDAITRHRPDVVLLDVQMPSPDGLEVLRELHRRRIDARVILLTASVADDEVLEAVRLGIRGLLSKECLADDVARCVRMVSAGGTCLDPEIVGRAMTALLTREAGQREAAQVLTRTEIRVVQLVAQRLRNREIADRLFVTEGTIKVHLHRIFEKLGISSREELVAYARQKGLAEAPRQVTPSPATKPGSD